jgi:hypothetical protein
MGNRRTRRHQLEGSRRMGRRGGRTDLALLRQSEAADTLQVSIHPSARIGTSVFLDHATASACRRGWSTARKTGSSRSRTLQVI